MVTQASVDHPIHEYMLGSSWAAPSGIEGSVRHGKSDGGFCSLSNSVGEADYGQPIDRDGRQLQLGILVHSVWLVRLDQLSETTPH